MYAEWRYQTQMDFTQMPHAPTKTLSTIMLHKPHGPEPIQLRPRNENEKLINGRGDTGQTRKRL